MEEALLQALTPGNLYIFLYVNSSAVVIGRNQSIYREVNLWHCWRNDIPIFRRISGGGAVYHDSGNINYSFVCSRLDRALDYSFFLKRIIDALKKLGVSASMNYKHDLIVAGRKISGTAQRFSKRNQLCHGTILFDTDLSQIEAVLHHPKSKIKTNALKSIEGKNLNLAEILKPCTFSEFYTNFINSLTLIKKQKLKDFLEKEVIRDNYISEEWTYGRSPETIFLLDKELTEYFGTNSFTVTKGKLTGMEGFSDKGRKFNHYLKDKFFTIQNVLEALTQGLDEPLHRAEELTKKLFTLG